MRNYASLFLKGSGSQGRRKPWALFALLRTKWSGGCFLSLAHVLGPAETLQPVASHPLCRASGICTQLSCCFFLSASIIHLGVGGGDCTLIAKRNLHSRQRSARSLGPFAAWLCGKQGGHSPWQGKESSLFMGRRKRRPEGRGCQ